MSAAPDYSATDPLAMVFPESFSLEAYSSAAACDGQFFFVFLSYFHRDTSILEIHVLVINTTNFRGDVTSGFVTVELSV